MPGWPTLAEQVPTPYHARVLENTCKTVLSFARWLRVCKLQWRQDNPKICFLTCIPMYHVPKTVYQIEISFLSCFGGTIWKCLLSGHWKSLTIVMKRVRASLLKDDVINLNCGALSKGIKLILFYWKLHAQEKFLSKLLWARYCSSLSISLTFQGADDD